MKRIEVELVEWIEANDRCQCGMCEHRIVKVTFKDGSIWYPKNSEMVAIKEIGKLVTRHNLDTDKFCFKAPKQEHNIMEVFK